MWTWVNSGGVDSSQMPLYTMYPSGVRKFRTDDPDSVMPKSGIHKCHGGSRNSTSGLWTQQPYLDCWDDTGVSSLTYSCTSRKTKNINA